MFSIVPDWAPNLHPLVVHFPIALLFGAVLIDLAALVARRFRGLHAAAVALYVLGTIGVVVAYLSGQEAVDTVSIPAEALSSVTTHENWALSTLIFFTTYSFIRLVVLFVKPASFWKVRGTLFAVALVGVYLVWHTGEHGGRLVFDHGVGVAAVGELTAELDELRARERALRAEGAAPVVDDDGSWAWHIAEGAELALVEAFDWLEGSGDATETEVIETGRGPVLSITTEEDIFLTAGEPIQNLQIEAVLNADDFDGRVELVHNVAEAGTYHFLALDEERIVQGRVVDGAEEMLGEGRRESTGWITLRASGSNGHFYAYEESRTVSHGHSDVPDAGPAGLRLDGDGTVLIERLEVQPAD